MKEILEVMDELLVAYERATPQIDHLLVQRVLTAMDKMKHVTWHGLLTGLPFKTGIAILALSLAVPAMAFDRSQNPDKNVSIGMDISTGKLAGIQKDVAAGAPHTDGGFVKGLLDVRVPISNALTIHAFGSSTGVNNNMQFSEGTEMGIGLRVFIQ